MASEKAGMYLKPATGYVPLYFAITLLIHKRIILYPDLLSTKPSTFGFVNKISW